MARAKGPGLLKGITKQAARSGADALGDIVAGKGAKKTLQTISKREKDNIAANVKKQILAAQRTLAQKGKGKKKTMNKRKTTVKKTKTKKKGPVKKTNKKKAPTKQNAVALEKVLAKYGFGF